MSETEEKTTIEAEATEAGQTPEDPGADTEAASEVEAEAGSKGSAEDVGEEAVEAQAADGADEARAAGEASDEGEAAGTDTGDGGSDEEAVKAEENAANEAVDAAEDAEGETKKVEGKKTADKKTGDKAKAKTPAEPLSPQIAALDEARKTREPVTGKVIGWNKGGFHVALGETPAFCPRSAIAVGEPDEPESYLNQELEFTVLEIRKGGKRIVVSRAGAIRAERTAQRKATLSEVKPGAILVGNVVSLTDFGAFVDIGGVQGLLHVSEISRSRVNHPSDALEEGQPIEVKVLKVEKGGKRISLSRKALEPDPWQAIGDFSEGQQIDGKVERAEKFGVLVEIAPGLSGLIPSSKLSLPADAQPQRVFPSGKELKVQIVSIDRKRKRISLLPEGAQVDGSKQDLDEYRKQQGDQKLGAMAAAFQKARSADG